MKSLISRLLYIFQSNSTKKNFAEKKQIRQQIREFKTQISETQRQQEADAVFLKIESLPEFKAAKSILLYWSTTNEMPTHDIINKWSNKKLIILPAVKGRNLVLKKYFASEMMEQGALGIWEPDSLETYDGKVDLVIVPGVAFDHNKNRLGRGKGYYDRFFRKDKNLKIGVGFDFQLLT